MLNLQKKLKEQKINESNKQNATVRKEAASVRDRLLQVEFQDLGSSLPPGCKLEFPTAELHNFFVSIKPEDGMYVGGEYRFQIEVPMEYNFEPPIVKCLTKIWHPNISENGAVCLSLLRSLSMDGFGWNPTRGIKDVILGLYALFGDLIDFDDPLNSDAAKMYLRNPTEFKCKVITGQVATANSKGIKMQFICNQLQFIISVLKRGFAYLWSICMSHGNNYNAFGVPCHLNILGVVGWQCCYYCCCCCCCCLKATRMASIKKRMYCVMRHFSSSVGSPCELEKKLEDVIPSAGSTVDDVSKNRQKSSTAPSYLKRYFCSQMAKKRTPEIYYGKSGADLPNFNVITLLETPVIASYTGPDGGLTEAPPLRVTVPAGIANLDDELSLSMHASSESLTVDRCCTDASLGGLKTDLLSKKRIVRLCDWISPDDQHSYGKSVSLYERNPITSKLAGNPVADVFAVCTRRNCSILILADGVNWGEKARLAARCAVRGSMDFLNAELFDRSQPITSTSEIFQSLLRAFHCGHRLILQEEGSFTTLCVVVVCPLENSEHWVACACNVGDSLAFIFSEQHGVRELTSGSHDIRQIRNMRDAGGALGPVYGISPDLQNFTCSLSIVDPGDIVFITSDGVSDNFDPVVGKFCINAEVECFVEGFDINGGFDPAFIGANGLSPRYFDSAADAPRLAYQSASSPTNCLDNGKMLEMDAKPLSVTASQRHELMLHRMDDIARHGCGGQAASKSATTARQLCESFVEFTKLLTVAKRKVLQDPDLYKSTGKNSSNEIKAIRRMVKYKLMELPGKLDHASVVAYRVGFVEVQPEADELLSGRDDQVQLPVRPSVLPFAKTNTEIIGQIKMLSSIAIDDSCETPRAEAQFEFQSCACKLSSSSSSSSSWSSSSGSVRPLANSVLEKRKQQRADQSSTASPIRLNSPRPSVEEKLDVMFSVVSRFAQSSSSNSGERRASDANDVASADGCCNKMVNVGKLKKHGRTSPTRHTIAVDQADLLKRCSTSSQEQQQKASAGENEENVVARLIGNKETLRMTIDRTRLIGSGLPLARLKDVDDSLCAVVEAAAALWRPSGDRSTFLGCLKFSVKPRHTKMPLVLRRCRDLPAWIVLFPFCCTFLFEITNTLQVRFLKNENAFSVRGQDSLDWDAVDADEPTAVDFWLLDDSLEETDVVVEDGAGAFLRQSVGRLVNKTDAVARVRPLSRTVSREQPNVRLVVERVSGRRWSSGRPAPPPSGRRHFDHQTATKGSSSSSPLCVTVFVGTADEQISASCAPSTVDGLCTVDVLVPLSWWPEADLRSTVTPDKPKRPRRTLRIAHISRRLSGDDISNCPTMATGQTVAVWPSTPTPTAGDRALIRLADQLQLHHRSSEYTMLPIDHTLGLLVPNIQFYPGSVFTISLHFQRRPQQQQQQRPVRAFRLRCSPSSNLRILLAQPIPDGAWAIKSTLISTVDSNQPILIDATFKQTFLNDTSAASNEVLIFVISVLSEQRNSNGLAELLWTVEYFYDDDGDVRELSDIGILSEKTSEEELARQRNLNTRFTIQKDTLMGLFTVGKTALVNTAVMTGKQIAIPMKVFGVSYAGVIREVTLSANCISKETSVLKVTPSCTAVYVDGSEVRGSANAIIQVEFSEIKSTVRYTVWFPELPVNIYLKDPVLHAIKNWHVPVMDSTLLNSNKQSISNFTSHLINKRLFDKPNCRKRYQETEVKIFARFRVDDMLSGWHSYLGRRGRQLLFDLTFLTKNYLKVTDSEIASIRFSANGAVYLQGLQSGRTEIQVLLPFLRSPYGVSEVTVVNELVNIRSVQLQSVCFLNVTAANTDGSDNIHRLYVSRVKTFSKRLQECFLDITLEYSDSTKSSVQNLPEADYEAIVQSDERSLLILESDLGFPALFRYLNLDEEKAGHIRASLYGAATCGRPLLGTGMVLVSPQYSSTKPHFFANSGRVRFYDSYQNHDSDSSSTRYFSKKDKHAKVDGPSSPVQTQRKLITTTDAGSDSMKTPEIVMYCLIGVCGIAGAVLSLNCLVRSPTPKLVLNSAIAQAACFLRRPQVLPAGQEFIWVQAEHAEHRRQSSHLQEESVPSSTTASTTNNSSSSSNNTSRNSIGSSIQHLKRHTDEDEEVEIEEDYDDEPHTLNGRHYHHQPQVANSYLGSEISVHISDRPAIEVHEDGRRASSWNISRSRSRSQHGLVDSSSERNISQYSFTKPKATIGDLHWNSQSLGMSELQLRDYINSLRETNRLPSRKSHPIVTQSPPRIASTMPPFFLGLLMSETDLLLYKGVKKYSTPSSRIMATEIQENGSFGSSGTRAIGLKNMKEDDADTSVSYDVPANLDCEEPLPIVLSQYEDFHTIDWQRDLARDRLRHKFIKKKNRESMTSCITGLVDAGSGWICVLFVGLTAGVVAGLVDISTRWMSDLKEGVCPDAFWFDREHCCWSANDTLFYGDKCNAWHTWPELFGHYSEDGLAYFVEYVFYTCWALGLAGLAAIFVRVFAPYACGSGIPEIKCMLSGFVIHGYLGKWTLIIKTIGLVLAAASGLSLGKEGPMVHLTCCIGNILSYLFPKYGKNEAKKREILSASAAAGVSVAFGAPIGGVLFSLEEASYYFPLKTLWRSFFCALIAGLILKFINPFGTDQTSLFAVDYPMRWSYIELIPFISLGIFGGVIGTIFIKCNICWCRFRKSSTLGDYPIAEVLSITFITALLSFPNEYTSKYREVIGVTNSTSDISFGSLMNGTIWKLVLSLIFKIVITIFTFGMKVPSGLFVPSLAIGAIGGRLVGITMEWLALDYRDAWWWGIYCEPGKVCVQPGLYAMVGAAAVLGGVTLSLVVIMFELTGSLEFIVPTMAAVMFAKWIGDAFDRRGIYDAHIALNGYPFLDNKEEFTLNSVAADVMRPRPGDLPLRVISQEGMTVGDIEELLRLTDHNGFPIVVSEDSPNLIGYVTRPTARKNQEGIVTDSLVYFSSNAPVDPEGPGRPVPLRLRKLLDLAPISITDQTPMETVIDIFRKLGLRQLLVTHMGKLLGIVTKKDVLVHIKELENEDTSTILSV
ncbi:H(+)/Cl(-) exchange transporter 4 [Trichinella patagoniensis]|uniref:Chloride channel protein n=2 Tax=Trichinella TaxID=6333 RepID=A0A0V0ZFN5_9BILA|nr:H(+)/Cl(-) exchange transporter 4 [Trichinella patagoniensis]